MREGARLVALGTPDRADRASRLASISTSMGIPCSIASSQRDEEFDSFDQGAIDWKLQMRAAHWMVNSSSMITFGQSPSMAWSASMTFAELEGCRNVMIVDLPPDREMISKSWGRVIGKVRQIHVLFFTEDATEAISGIEKIAKEELLSDVRKRTMIPIVCSYSENDNTARVSHALGSFEVKMTDDEGGLEWLAGFLNALPLSGPGINGLRAAASWK